MSRASTPWSLRGRRATEKGRGDYEHEEFSVSGIDSGREHRYGARSSTIGALNTVVGNTQLVEGEVEDAAYRTAIRVAPNVRAPAPTENRASVSSLICAARIYVASFGVSSVGVVHSTKGERWLWSSCVAKGADADVSMRQHVYRLIDRRETKRQCLSPCGAQA